MVNERGIFRVAVLRYILMRIIYNTKYPEIDKNISDCQMGARKGKSCKNNLFIINGIIHDVMKSKKKKPIVLQIYDYAQMFDSINLKKAISDVFDAGLKDDNLILIHKANEEVNMAVNTPSGLSERQILKNNVLQGDTWGSLLASVQVDSIGKECEKSTYGYLYKDNLQVSLLGLVDDMIGVTEAGYKAQQMNALINVQTAGKGLQFGVTKCKAMLVGKDTANVLYSDLTVDKWSSVHMDTTESGVDELVDIYEGQVVISRTDEQKYLGFVLSSKGDNMVNINHMKKKAKGIIRRIFDKLESITLKQYYFECALVLMNAMLRSSILYACETYYDLKESEVRQLERIEEQFLRELLKTGKGCPITQLYLEVGQMPARFIIIKTRLLFLKYILNQSQDSMINKFYQLQLESSAKGDWTTMCMNDLKNLEIVESLDDIQKMSIYSFKKLINKKLSESALSYLTGKQGSKGGEIVYTKLELADYLSPICKQPIETKRRTFEIRNRMWNIPANFSSKEIKHKCFICQEDETMEHIYTCEKLNIEAPKTEYRKIFSNNPNLIFEVQDRFENNFTRRGKLINEIEEENEKKKETENVKPPHHVILPSDPLYAV